MDVEANASVISYNNREVVCTVVRDVTERKKAEETCLRLSAIVESSDDAIIGKTLDGIITSWNSGAERIYGYSADEAVGHPISMLVPPERPEEIPTILERIRRGEKVDHSETVRVAKDGQRLDISLTVSPIRSPAGDIVGASTIARDITERKGAEEKIEQAEERTRFQARLLDAVGEAVISTDAEGRVVYWNRVAEQMYGWSAQEVTGQRLRKVISLDERLADRILSELREGRGHTREIMVNRKDGTTFPVLVTNTPLRDERGNLVATIGISRDVTERKMAEEVLRRSEERFRSSFRDAAIGMALVGTDGRWLQVNRSLCQMLGYSEEELLGKTFQGITHPDDLDADLDHVRRMLTGEIETYQMQKRYLHADGRVVWSLLSVSMVHDEEGEPLYFVSQIRGHHRA
jgi:PAS domain S-box-containing protein